MYHLSISFYTLKSQLKYTPIVFLQCVFCVHKPDCLMVGYMYTVATHGAMHKISL